MFNRSIQFLSLGIKPIWVFDGKPPEMKKGELKRRHDIKANAEDKKGEAEEEGKLAEAKMMAGRSIKVTPEMTADAKRLIQLMGLPIVEASSEAEAQCAVLCRAGKVYAVATEDMDTLTFGSPVLIRGFNNKKEPLTEIKLDVVLKEFGMTMPQFIDLCILCGCDYTPHIEGIGPVKAFKFMQDHKTMEEVIGKALTETSKKTQESRYKVPAGFDYATARKLFTQPDVIDPAKVEIKWGKPDEAGLKKFLVDEKNFSIERVDTGLKKILKSQAQGTQSRLDSFFAPHKVVSSKVPLPSHNTTIGWRGHRGQGEARQEGACQAGLQSEEIMPHWLTITYMRKTWVTLNPISARTVSQHVRYPLAMLGYYYGYVNGIAVNAGGGIDNNAMVRTTFHSAWPPVRAGRLSWLLPSGGQSPRPFSAPRS